MSKKITILLLFALLPTLAFSGCTRTNSPPQADAGEDIRAELGETVSFSGRNSTDKDDLNLNFYWDFDNRTDSNNDGDFENDKDAQGETVQHTFKRCGTYFVTLTVDDGEDSDNDTIRVEVVGDESIDITTVSIKDSEDLLTIKADFVLPPIIDSFHNYTLFLNIKNAEENSTEGFIEYKYLCWYNNEGL